MKHPLRTTAVIGALGITATLVAGCGPSPSAGGAGAGTLGTAKAVYEQFDAMSSSERESALVEAAEQEGEITAYLRSDDVFQELEDAFEAKYDIDLTLVNPGRVDVVRQQVLEQAAAGRMEADLVEVFTSDIELVYGEQGVAAPVPAFVADSAPDPSLNTTFAIETVQYPWIPLWNTDAITEPPRSLEDFLTPEYAGKMVIATGVQEWYLGWFQILTVEGDMSIDDFETLFRGIASNTSVVDSNNPAAAGVASGEYVASPGVALVSAQRIGDEAPMTWSPSWEKTVVSPAGIAFMSDAPHPAAAMLFAQWYITEGADILEKEQFVVQNPNETDLADTELYRPDLTGMTSEQFAEWRVAYDNLIKGKDDILPAYVRE